MCGRYALAYPPQEIGRRLIEDGMPVDEAPDDEGVNQGYNVAPGNIQPIYRAIPRPDVGRPAEDENDENGNNGAWGRTQGNGSNDVKYVLEPMKWGLIPSWTKRKPDYGTLMKTINCRDDSLFEDTGIWTSMKHKKRCIVFAQGFYEWLKKGNDKIPHFIKRKDGKLLCMAGLWDCAQYEGTTEKLYSYTVITTASNKQLSFIHHRMPVIFENGSEDIRTWLSPTKTWSTELQSLLKPYEDELEIYPVVKDVGNVRNNSPTFIIPLDSKENKTNIKNFFAAPQKLKVESPKAESGTSENNAPQNSTTKSPLKRERDEFEGIADTVPAETTDIRSPPSKAVKFEDSFQSSGTLPSTPRIRSATSNLANKKTPTSSSKKKPVKRDDTPKITSFFTR